MSLKVIDCVRGDRVTRKGKNSTFDYATYMNNYIKENVVYRRINFSRSNPEDEELLEWLDDHKPIAQYLKQLIKKDKFSNKNPVE